MPHGIDGAFGVKSLTGGVYAGRGEPPGIFQTCGPSPTPSSGFVASHSVEKSALWRNLNIWNK